MNGNDNDIVGHYSRSELTTRILKALGADGAGAPPPTLAAIRQVDQLHHGGFGLTEKLAAAAGITTGMHVLDAGSGIGGGARHLAASFDCSVEALDLTPNFVKTAEDLDALVGLSGRISHRVGSVTDLPYDDQSFDAVWSMNVTMNISDKLAMFSEMRRVLRSGGVFAFTHLAGGIGETPTYPLPWASSPGTSFLDTPGEIMDLLAASGFEGASDHMPDTVLAPPPPSAGGPDETVVMGEDMPLRLKNAQNSAADGRLIAMMVSARRPA